MKRSENLDGLPIQWLIGLFMVVFGVMGLMTHFMPYTSTEQVRLGFSAASAGLLVGASLVMQWKPTTFVIAFWIGTMFAVWQFKYGALPF